eukprot:8499186-Alexandrium_andersonii.AAC.1
MELIHRGSSRQSCSHPPVGRLDGRAGRVGIRRRPPGSFRSWQALNLHLHGRPAPKHISLREL